MLVYMSVHDYEYCIWLEYLNQSRFLYHVYMYVNFKASCMTYTLPEAHVFVEGSSVYCKNGICFCCKRDLSFFP